MIPGISMTSYLNVHFQLEWSSIITCPYLYFIVSSLNLLSKALLIDVSKFRQENFGNVPFPKLVGLSISNIFIHSM